MLLQDFLCFSKIAVNTREMNIATASDRLSLAEQSPRPVRRFGGTSNRLTMIKVPNLRNIPE
jgi:hypothetical protein